MDEKKLPTSRWGRLARLAALGTRAGVGKLAAKLGANAAEPALAEYAAQALGTMRGLALKVGQMASYVDGMVPSEHRDAYEAALRKLRAAAPTMSAEAAREVVVAELGRPPEELFDRWDPEPFASASIGQVHRARMPDGWEVAVKVQFQGVDQAVRGDLDNASLFGSLLGPIGEKFAMADQLAEIRARFLEELDYQHEAERQMEFARVFAADPLVRIPRVVRELSGRRVLTSTFAPGVAFDVARTRGEDERRAWASTLWHFVFKSLLHHGLFNADPHPGNYLFEPGGVVHFLDFGCTRRLSGRHAQLVQACHRAASRGDLDGLFAASSEMLELPKSGPSVPLARAYVERCFTPIWTKGPYRITHEFAASLWEGMRDNAVALWKGNSEDFKALPGEWVFFNRLQLGFYSVLARLDVDVDYNALDAELVASAPS
jgi:predicted unusual protein kinase regulating ubiquinone biosynthesis (AarF/ABC1/UbiB family)